MSKSIKGTQIDGDVSVGRNVAIGGKVTIQGNSHLKGNVKIDGWLDATNIKGTNKGFFRSIERLNKIHPKPLDGWSAYVGTTLPAPIYIAENGKWVNTGEIGGKTIIDIEQYDSEIDDIQQDITSIKSKVQSIEWVNQTQDTHITDLTGKAETSEQEITAIKTTLSEQNTTNTKVQEGITSIKSRVQSVEEKNQTQDTHIADLTGKAESIIIVDGFLENSENTTNRGIYLKQNSKGKITKLINVTGSGSSSYLQPEKGKLYVFDNHYYAFDGREINKIGSGGNGSGAGFLNLTKEYPLPTGQYYNLETAIAKLQELNLYDEEKSGMIITFKTDTGWEDYRFEGSSLDMFSNTSAWKVYDRKDVISKIKVLRGTSEEDLTPDTEGSVTLSIPVVEVDETINENSTNPVQNKSIATAFKSLAGKYGSALRLNTIGDGNDKGYSLSLLSESGEELSTSEVFTGGGSSGNVATTKIVLTRLTKNPTVKVGDEVLLNYKYEHIDTTSEQSTGNSAKVTVTITRGATSFEFENVISAGSTNIVDATKFIDVGVNTVKVRVEVGDGEEKQVSRIAWTINVVQLTLTSSFNIASIINRNDIVQIPYTLTGAGQKTLRCFVNGIDTEDRTISTSTANGLFAINTTAMAHGEHSVQLVAELELLDGTIIKSNSIYFDIAVREESNKTPLIATRFDYQDDTVLTTNQRPYINAKQFGSYDVNFAVYNPTETPTTATIYSDDKLLSSSSVNFVANRLNFRTNIPGQKTNKIVCGTKEYLFLLNTEQTSLNIVEPIDGLQLKLTAQGRSNTDTNKTEWNYKKINSEFTGFNWGGDGWIKNALRHSGDSRTVVKYQPFKQPQLNSNNATTFIIKYKVEDVTNDNVELIKCIDDSGTGFVITPTEARLTTRGNSELSMKLAVGNEYEIGFVSFPKATDGSSDYEKENSEMVYLYINGVMSGAVQRGSSDSIYQVNPQYIKMGNTGATLNVYLMRAYNTFLTDDQMLSCYIIDQSSAEELVKIYNENDILNSEGNIGLENIPDGMRVVIVTGKQENDVPTVLQAAVNNNKKTKYNVDEVLSYVKNGKPEQNFRLIGGCIRLQGTSSLAYPIKNYRIYLYNSAKIDGQLYLGCNEQGVGGTLQEVAKFSFRLSSKDQYAGVPVNCFCTKADFAESSSSHNTGMARIVQNTLTSIKELTPPQKYVDRSQYNYDIRTTIDGEPCLYFYRKTIEDTPIFLGKFNWNNDKSTENVFGFLDIPGYHDQSWVTDKFGGKNPTECWEFLNNDYPMGMFLDDDFDTTGEDGKPNWLKVFEARFPDDKKINAQYEAGTLKPKHLERLVKWVKSTDTTAQGLSQSQITERQNKFRNELANYFDVKYLCDYYQLTDIFACVDQRVKNMMMAFWYDPKVEKMLAYMIFYDNDTILGVRNDGRLKYHWDIDENTIDTELSTSEKTVYAFAGHDSVLWKNLREQFPDELKKAYKRLRQKLTNEYIFKHFDTAQTEKFCERVYNLDALNKYIDPKTLGVEVNKDGTVTNVKYSYLEAMQGDRTSHRHWFVINRLGLFDAWGSTGQYTSIDISFKGNSASGATVRATALRDFYFEFRREGETMLHKKVRANEEFSYTYNNVANIGTIFHLLGGAWMKKLDLSDWGGFTDINIPTLPVLEELILGNSSNTYTLTEMVLDVKVPMLRKLDIVNYTNIPALDLSGCKRLETVNATGCTSLATITFAQGSPLSAIHLPSNFQTLILRSLPKLQRSGITFDNMSNITGLWVENCEQLNGLDLFNEILSSSNSKLKYVRITNLNLKGDGRDLKKWYDLGLDGIDEQGNPVNGKCKLSGNYQLTSYVDDDLFEEYRKRFDELNIRQAQYTLIGYDDTVADDANYTNYDNKTGYEFGNTYQPSGHISRILSERFGCLGKQVTKGTMTICKLHDDNWNYYADNEEAESSTPAKLDGTEGDVFIYEPEYWYKGINDYLGVFSDGVRKKYACYSYGQEPDTPKNVVKITKEELISAGKVRENYKIVLGNSSVKSSYTQSNGNSVCEVSISGYKYVRFTTVLGENNTGSIFTNSDGDIVEPFKVNILDDAFVDGMYIIYKVPENADKLFFTINDNVDFEYIVLSNSENIVDYEPEWVKHDACLIGALRNVTNNDGKLCSIISEEKPISLNYLIIDENIKKRNLEMISYDQYKDIVNLYVAKYGRRNSVEVFGKTYATVTLAKNGISTFLGMKDTHKNTDDRDNSYYTDKYNAQVKAGFVKEMGYENFRNSVWVQEFLEYNNVKDARNIYTRNGRILLQENNNVNTAVYTKYIVHSKYMDIFQINKRTGSSSTYYSVNQSMYTLAVTTYGYFLSCGNTWTSTLFSLRVWSGRNNAKKLSILSFSQTIKLENSISKFKSLPKGL